MCRLIYSIIPYYNLLFPSIVAPHSCYNFATDLPSCPFTRVTAAAAKAGAFLSLTFVAVEGDLRVRLCSQYKYVNPLTEDDLVVAFFPHLRDQGLTGDDGARESHLDIRVWTERLEDMLSGNAHGAKSVQNCKRRGKSILRAEDGAQRTWLLETTHGGKVGVDVQWVSVTGQPKANRLSASSGNDYRRD